MAVDIRLNDMINALDKRMREIDIDDCELSVRTRNALRKIGAKTLWDAQGAILNRTLIKQYGIGPKAVREVQEIIDSVSQSMPPIPKRTAEIDEIEHTRLHGHVEKIICKVLDEHFDGVDSCGAAILTRLLCLYLREVQGSEEASYLLGYLITAAGTSLATPMGSA